MAKLEDRRRSKALAQGRPAEARSLRLGASEQLARAVSTKDGRQTILREAVISQVLHSVSLSAGNGQKWILCERDRTRNPHEMMQSSVAES